MFSQNREGNSTYMLLTQQITPTGTEYTVISHTLIIA